MTQVLVRNSTFIPLKSVNNQAEFITFSGLSDNQEHLAIRIGKWSKNTIPLVRIHSECLTGDVFHSLRCDCGEQLAEALALLDLQGGILLYLRQEGRGIGLYNKIDAYQLQSKGFDTYQANQQLGFPTDGRDFSTVADMLLAIGVSRIRLLTNNPEKKDQLERYGIEIQEVINTGIFLSEFNKNYLHTKKEKTTHSLNLK